VPHHRQRRRAATCGSWVVGRRCHPSGAQRPHRPSRSRSHRISQALLPRASLPRARPWPPAGVEHARAGLHLTAARHQQWGGRAWAARGRHAQHLANSLHAVRSRAVTVAESCSISVTAGGFNGAAADLYYSARDTDIYILVDLGFSQIPGPIVRYYSEEVAASAFSPHPK
jgi:hypothetical protein